MSDFEITKILNILTETEIKEENWSTKSLDNLRKLWNRDNEMLYERLAKMETELTAHQRLKNKVENLKKDIMKININEGNNRRKIAELKSVLQETDIEICSKQSEEEKLKQHYDTRRKELSKLEKVETALKNHHSLYDDCLSTRLCCEGSNLFKLSFINRNQCSNWIKFEFNDDKNHFTVVDFEPKNLIPGSVLSKFHETQDTQGLLCYVSQNLLTS